MSAVETTTSTPALPVEEVKPTETAPATEPSAPTEAPKEDAAAPEAKKADAAQEDAPPAASSDLSPQGTKATESTATEAKNDVRQSPSLLAKILAGVKERVKSPRSPKKEKKEELKPATDDEQPSKTEEAPSAEASASKEPETTPEVPAETSTEPATATGEEPTKEEAKEENKVKQSAVKVGRRLSSRVSRVGEFFKAKKTEHATPAKVDENPPKIDEPVPVAPLENPATATAETTSAPTPVVHTEESKSEVPPVAPVVAAAA